MRIRDVTIIRIVPFARAQRMVKQFYTNSILGHDSMLIAIELEMPDGSLHRLEEANYISLKQVVENCLTRFTLEYQLSIPP